MFNKSKKKGSVLLEVLIAIGLSAIFFSAIAGLLVASNKSTSSLYLSQKAYWRAQEGISALQSMLFEDITITNSAQVSYSAASDTWDLLPGIETFDNGMTRTVSITEVQRDDDCVIVESGGTVDPDSLYLSTVVNYEGMGAVEKEVALSTLSVNWQNPVGECFNPTDAGGISLDWSGAYWGGSKQLRGVYIINHTDHDITITKMRLYWDRPTSRLQQIFAIGTKVWSESGPGTPTGQQTSGTLIDIADATIPAGFTDDTHKVQFTGAMDGSTLIFEFEFSDGSILTTDPFTP
jgi:hypothetical protein